MIWNAMYNGLFNELNSSIISPSVVQCRLSSASYRDNHSTF